MLNKVKFFFFIVISSFSFTALKNNEFNAYFYEAEKRKRGEGGMEKISFTITG